MSNKTIGSLALEAAHKTPETLNAVDLRVMLLDEEEYRENLIKCAQDYQKNNPGDFFIQVITRRERLMERVIRNQFVATDFCPTPDYDRSVYKYHAKEEQIEYLWTLPCKEACHYLILNQDKIHPDERQLLQFVIDDANGILLQRAKRLNSEAKNTPLIVEG